LIGLGPSSISRYHQGYVQNITATGEYEKAVFAGHLPATRGIEFSRDDVATGWLIERLMCDFEFSVGELVRQFGDCSQPLLAKATRLAQREPDKLRLEGDRFIVPTAQRPLVRTIAARFDQYLQRGTLRHSVAV
jgi:oxygen-independent coproporphyrinogen-3 oxidase